MCTAGTPHYWAWVDMGSHLLHIKRKTFIEKWNFAAALTCRSRGEPMSSSVSIWWYSQSDNITGPSFNRTKRNVPQSNVTGPNNSNVVAVRKWIPQLNTGEVSVILSVLPTAHHISAQKQRLPLAKNFNSPSDCLLPLLCCCSYCLEINHCEWETQKASCSLMAIK